MLNVCIATTKNLVDGTWVQRDKEILESLGLRVQIIGIDSEIPLLGILKNIRKYALQFRNCDVVIAWFAFPSTILLSKIMGIPIVANAVGYEIAYYPEILYGLPKNPMVRFIISLALKLADEVIAISRESLRWAFKWGKKRGFVIYEGIDFDKYDCSKIQRNGNSPGEPIILTISYLGLTNIVRKDIPTLIKALKEVKKYYPTVKLYIVGEKMDGYFLLKQLVQKLDLENNVIFTGKLSHEHLLELLCRANLFVMTSYQEGFPTAACEASSAGIPVIVSNRPAMNEVFTDETAVVVEPGNPYILAQAIIKTLENKEETIEKARRAQIIIRQKYSINIRRKKINNFMIYFFEKLRINIRGYYKYNIKYVVLFLSLLLAWFPLFVLSSVIFKSFNRFKQKRLIKYCLTEARL